METAHLQEPENPGGVLVTPQEVAQTTRDLLAADRTGVIVELLGGASKVVEEGHELRPRPAR